MSVYHLQRISELSITVENGIEQKDGFHWGLKTQGKGLA